MNAKVLAGIVAGVVVLGGAYFFLSGGNEASVTVSSDSEESVKNRFAALVQSGQSYQCTFEYNDGENVSSGTVYMAGGAERLRGDFNVTDSAAGAMEVHMVRDGGYNYLWGSTMPQGIKMAVTNEETLFEGETNSPVNEDVDYECRPWNVDNDKFELPSDIEFQDMTAFQANMEASMGGGANANQCQACDMIGDANAKASCKAAMGCE